LRVNPQLPAVACRLMARRLRTTCSLFISITLLWSTNGHTQPKAGVIDAVKAGDLVQLQLLIAADEDLDLRQGDGATALHHAAHRDDLEAARLLVTAGATVRAANELGATPLWLAARNGNSAMASLLLNAGADPDSSLQMGETPLMTAARSGDLKTVSLLLDHGAAVNAAEHERQQTSLMWAAAQGHSRIVRTLIDHGANIHARTAIWDQLENTAGNTNPIGNFRMKHGGSSALMFAVRQGHLETAKTLIEAGANVNDHAASGTSALVVAAHSGHGSLGIYLLQQGADPNSANAGYTPLQAAVLLSQTGLAKTLLAYGADPNTALEHGTPGRRFSADYSLRYQMIGANAAWLAAKYGELEIFRTVLRYGGDPLNTPPGGMSALQASMGATRGTENRRNRVGIPEPDDSREEANSLEFAQLLLDHGVQVNTADSRGNTALHDAVRKRFRSVVELLIAHGADPHANNERDETPIGLAESDDLSPGTETDDSIISILRGLKAAS